MARKCDIEQRRADGPQRVRPAGLWGKSFPGRGNSHGEGLRLSMPCCRLSRPAVGAGGGGREGERTRGPDGVGVDWDPQHVTEELCSWLCMRRGFEERFELGTI